VRASWQRSKVETWGGLAHALEEEPFEVTLTAFVAEARDAFLTEDGRTRAIADRAGLAAVCRRFGFGEAPRAPAPPRQRGTLTCPYDGLPARLMSFSCEATTVENTVKFCGALRAALGRRAAGGALARVHVDGWGSWRLTSLDRYENYYDFDPDSPFRYMLHVPPYALLAQKWPLSSPRPSPRSGLPRATLVLDLDETLIHTEVDPIADADFTFTLSSPEGCQCMHVRVRPHAEHFLNAVAAKFEVIVFTASERPYAESVLRKLDPTGCLVDHVLCREDCTFIEGEFVKDLGALKRDLKRVALVDNRPEMYCYHPDNGVPISSWFEDRRDCELLRLLPSLNRIAVAHDVREYIASHWRTFEHVERVGLALGVSRRSEPGISPSGSYDSDSGECAEDYDEELYGSDSGDASRQPVACFAPWHKPPPGDDLGASSDEYYEDSTAGPTLPSIDADSCHPPLRERNVDHTGRRVARA